MLPFSICLRDLDEHQYLSSGAPVTLLDLFLDYFRVALFVSRVFLILSVGSLFGFPFLIRAWLRRCWL